MLEAEASQRELKRQVFWLSACNVPRTAFPPWSPKRLRQWLCGFEELADHSGGPATDLHRFPFSPRANGQRGTY